MLDEFGACGRHGSVRRRGRLLGPALRLGGPVGLGWWLGCGLRLRRRGGARSLTPEGASYSGCSGGGGGGGGGPRERRRGRKRAGVSGGGGAGGRGGGC